LSRYGEGVRAQRAITKKGGKKTSPLNKVWLAQRKEKWTKSLKRKTRSDMYLTQICTKQGGHEKLRGGVGGGGALVLGCLE